MSAVLFCPPSTLQRVVSSLQEEGLLCEVTNINSPIQTVVSGEERALDALQGRLHKEGRRIAVKRLNVAYPFHASILHPEADRFDEFIRSSIQSGALSIADPVVPVISNVDGAVVCVRLCVQCRCVQRRT